jgi:transposase
MRYIHLSEAEQVTLQEAVRNHPSAIVRSRSQSLLLSHRGYAVQELARLNQVRTRTIYEWFSRWQSIGLVGLRITTGRGRKAVLQAQHTPLVEETVSLDCQDLKQASVVLSETLAIPISKGQLKRFLKSAVTVGAACANGSSTNKTHKLMPVKRPNY